VLRATQREDSNAATAVGNAPLAHEIATMTKRRGDDLQREALTVRGQW
jgi:hypothetical protein